VSEERLQKIVAAAGLASRRAAETLIAAGRVTVDGRVATLGERVDPATSEIRVDGRPLPGPPSLVHLACHKPAGYTSTVRDRHAARTVLELVPPDLVPPGVRLFPVGRLDRDSEGLLLLTNDGPWAERAIHPRHGNEREYAVALAAPLEPRQLRGLRTGVPLEEGVAVPLAIRLASAAETARLAALVDPRPDPGLAWYRITVGHGWRRLLRRMLGAVGAPVVRLVRVRLGAIRLGHLRAGQMRVLDAAEVHAIGQGRRGGGQSSRRPGPQPGPPPRTGPGSAGPSSRRDAASGRRSPAR
jgi:23S rRNA pseudouridine2605 synthase